MAELVTLQTFLDHQEAQIVRGLLEQNGIVVFAEDQYFANASFMHLFAIGGARIRVVDDELEAAGQIVSQKDDSLNSGGAEQCPDCGAGDIHRAASIILATFFFAWLGIPYMRATRRRKCRQCGHKWTAR